jgi:hypothetical protein
MSVVVTVQLVAVLTTGVPGKHTIEVVVLFFAAAITATDVVPKLPLWVPSPVYVAVTVSVSTTGELNVTKH